MRTGAAQAALPTLAGPLSSPAYLPDLTAAKAAREQGAAAVPRARVEQDMARLHTLLDEAQDASALPDAPSAYDALHDFVVRVRRDGVRGGAAGPGIREDGFGVLER